MTDLFARHGPDDPVFFSHEGRTSVDDVWRDVTKVAAALGPQEAPQRILLVFESDRHAFLVALLATWARGDVAVLPPDNRRTTLTHLKAATDAILHDTNSGLRVRVQDVLQSDETPAPAEIEAVRARTCAAWREGHARTEIFSSTVRPPSEPWPLAAAALEAELAALRTLAPWTAGRQVMSTVPIGHRYGLVWGALRPITEGASVWRPMRPSAATLAGVESHEDIDLLVTVPSQLEALARLDPHDVRKLRTIVTSCASLPDKTAQALDPFPAAVIDVLSNSACGTLAVHTDGHWRGLEHVELERAADETLRVRERAQGDFHDTVDICRLDRVDGETRITLLGRTTQYVRAGDVEVDTHAIEAFLAARPDVEDAAVFSSPEAAWSVAARILICVASPSEDHAALQAAIDAEFDLTPGLTDLVVGGGVPRDGLGRLARSQALTLFGLGPNGHPRAFEANWQDAQIDGERAEFTVHIPEDYRWFDGHFDNYPVLPAAVQLHELVLPGLARTGWNPGRVARYERLKFTGRIMPGDTLTLTLTVAKPGMLRFALANDGKPASSGVLRTEAS